MPKFTLVLFAALAAWMPHGATAQDAPSSSTWNGTLKAGGTDLRLQVDIRRSGDGHAGELISLDP